MLVFYGCFGGGWSGSGVMFNIIQSVPAYKKQMVAYYRVVILINLSNLVGKEVLYCLHGGIILFNTYKMSRMKKTCCTIGIIFLRNLCYYFITGSAT